MDLDFEDIYDIVDDVLVFLGGALAILTAYRIEGIVLALVGVGIMYSKGEFSKEPDQDAPDPYPKLGAEDSSGEEDETGDEDDDSDDV